MTLSNLTFTLIDSYNMSMVDIENMIIWERDVYISLLNNRIEEENNRKEEQKTRNYMANIPR